MGPNIFSHLASSSSFDKPKSLPVGRAKFTPYSYDFDDLKNRLRKLEKANSLQPRADKYTIIKTFEVGDHCVLELQYKKCTNYEGRKILVFKNIHLPELLERNSRLIDPHFSENTDYVSPVARFEPTEDGIEMAIQFARNIL